MTREQLIASLTTVSDPRGWNPSDEDDPRYADWSDRTPDGGYQVEIGDRDDNVVQLGMTRDELVQLHHALTLTLLQDS